MRVEHRLSKLEQVMAPAPEQVNIIHLLVDPDIAGNRIVKAVAMNGDRTTTTFVREPGETRDALLGRVELAMGWAL